MGTQSSFVGALCQSTISDNYLDGHFGAGPDLESRRGIIHFDCIYLVSNTILDVHNSSIVW